MNRMNRINRNLLDNFFILRSEISAHSREAVDVTSAVLAGFSCLLDFLAMKRGTDGTDLRDN